MPLDPEVKAYLDRVAASGAPPRGAMSVDETRRAYRGIVALSGEAPELTRVEDRTIPGPGGPLPVRLYDPSDAGGLPVLAYFHGGRFFSGDLETHDPVCRILADLSGWMVVAVDYRLAPEHRFPAAAEDGYAAAAWLADHAGEIGGDPRRVAVGGDSAGGNLAAVAALQAHRLGAPRLCCQMLIYPMLDATCSLGSHRTVGAGFGAGSEDMLRGYREYLGDADPRDPRISPLLTGDLSGLPPAYVLSAEYDSLRDEAESYARALAEAGVPVVADHFDGAIHGIFQLGGVIGLGRKAIDSAAGFLRDCAGERG